MTQFEEQVLQDLAELKAHMRWIIGNGHEGKLQQLERRVQKHESVLQKFAGMGAAVGLIMTIIHFAFDYMRVVHR